MQEPEKDLILVNNYPQDSYHELKVLVQRQAEEIKSLNERLNKQDKDLEALKLRVIELEASRGANRQVVLNQYLRRGMAFPFVPIHTYNNPDTGFKDVS